MADRLLRAHRTLLLVPVVEVGGEPYLLGGTKAAPITCPMSAPTAAVLNSWLPVETSAHPLAGIGGNISASTLDDVDLGLADSDTDKELTIISRGDEESITNYQVDASFTFLRDEDPQAPGKYNYARDLVIAPDARYAAVDRAYGEFLYNDPFAAGQVADLYEVETDVAPDELGDKASIKLKQAFLPTGEVAVGVTIA